MLRLNIVGAVFRKELREMLRDRRSLIVMLGLPLVLYPLLAIGIATLQGGKKRELTERVGKVVLNDPDSAPHLRDMLAAKVSGLELGPPRSPADVQRSLADGSIDAAIEVTPDLEQEGRAGNRVEVKVRLDRSRTTADFVERKIRRIIDNYQRWLTEQRLAERKIPLSVLAPVEMTTDDVADPSQRFGHLLAQALPVLLLMTGMLGALFPALNATTTERELGTMESLLLTPARRFELLAAKGLLVLLCALLTAGLNMLSMSATLLRALTLVSDHPLNLSISPSMLILSYIAAVPALIFFSALVLIVGLVARNFREANSFATPVMLIPLTAFAIAMSEPKATAALLITPVASTTIVIREVLTGRATVGQFLLAFSSSCLYAGIILSFAGRLFSSEQLVNPAWEPVSLKLFRRREKTTAPRLPAVDEALILFCISLLLLFYISPNFLKHGLLAEAIANEILLILVPTLLYSMIARWDWRKTFSLNATSTPILIAAALLGIGLSPWAPLLKTFQDKLWHPDPETERDTMNAFVAALQTYPVIKVIVIGFLAGVCEEILFRGPIQCSMLRRIPAWAAILFTALLFAGMHLDVHGFPLRTLLGMLLGWIVWRTGSIYPAMLAHGLYDISSLAMAAWQIHHSGLSSIGTFTPLDYWALGIGGVLIVVSVVMWFRLSPSMPREALATINAGPLTPAVRGASAT
jgi:sodium transport system permease protein